MTTPDPQIDPGLMVGRLSVGAPDPEPGSETDPEAAVVC